jgi:hypothetical protein
MSDELLMTLLPAMDIAVFSRRADGSFVALTPPPAWFPRLADVTFPFLGHILEEASEFWRTGQPGSREYGPCAEVDERGREFHYRVRALTVEERGHQFLIFELDSGSDRLREALQTAREQSLAFEKSRAEQRAAASEIRARALEMMQLLSRLPASVQADVAGALGAKCNAVMRSAEAIGR